MLCREPVVVRLPDFLQGVLRELPSRRHRHPCIWGPIPSAVPPAATAERERCKREPGRGADSQTASVWGRLIRRRREVRRAREGGANKDAPPAQASAGNELLSSKEKASPTKPEWSNTRAAQRLNSASCELRGDKGETLQPGHRR